MSEEPLVVVCTVAGRMEAERIQSWLEAEGIPAMVSQEGAGSAYGLAVGVMGDAAVLVPASRAAEAEAWLAAMRSGELEANSAGSDPDIDALISDAQPAED
jgi:Putative prokaryotic signal transducing protein